LEPGEHGFHIHQFGDMSQGCESMGPHYDPEGVDHGDLDQGHVGDLGNITADDSGTSTVKIVAERVDLTGEQSVVGRGIVVHADKDDLGKGGDAESLKTGNAGDRLACGVITLKETVEEDIDVSPESKIDIERAMKYLDDRQREVLQMRYKHDMTYKAIGQELGVSAGRAEQILKRILRILRHPTKGIMTQPEQDEFIRKDYERRGWEVDEVAEAEELEEITRRNLLKGIGVAGAAAATGAKVDVAKAFSEPKDINRPGYTYYKVEITIPGKGTVEKNFDSYGIKDAESLKQELQQQFGDEYEYKVTKIQNPPAEFDLDPKKVEYMKNLAKKLGSDRNARRAFEQRFPKMGNDEVQAYWRAAMGIR